MSAQGVGGAGLSASGSKGIAPVHPDQSEVNVLSSQIASEIDKTFRQVQELKKMAKSKAIFNDKSSEIQDLTIKVKDRIGRLNEAVQALETKAKGIALNKNSQAHSTNMVTTLNARLLEVTRDFKDALEERSRALGEQDKRRKLYAVGEGPSSNPFAQRQRPTDGGASPDLEGAQGGGGQPMAMAVASSRAVAVENVQKTIGELAVMFQKMATLVTLQEEMVQRIDHDVDDASSNVKAGHQSLYEYYKNSTGNRALIIKVVLILVFFVIFFIIFIA